MGTFVEGAATVLAVAAALAGAGACLVAYAACCMAGLDDEDERGEGRSPSAELLLPPGVVNLDQLEADYQAELQRLLGSPLTNSGLDRLCKTDQRYPSGDGGGGRAGALPPGRLSRSMRRCASSTLVGALVALCLGGCAARYGAAGVEVFEPGVAAAEAERLALSRPGVLPGAAAPGYVVERAIRICPLLPVNRQAQCIATLL